MGKSSKSKSILSTAELIKLSMKLEYSLGKERFRKAMRSANALTGNKKKSIELVALIKNFENTPNESFREHLYRTGKKFFPRE